MSRCLNNNDILLEISGGGPDQPVGRTVLITQSIINNFPYPAVCTNFLRLMRPVKNISATYLNYYLNKFYLSGEVTNYQGGSNNLRNLKFKEYSKINIPIPSINEQKIIAEKLDLLLAQVQETKSRLEQIPELLKQFRQSVLSDAVSGKLTEEWRESKNLNDWKNGILKDFIKKPSYGTSTKSKKVGSVPVLRMGNLKNGNLDWADLVYTSDQTEIDKYELIAGDVLFNRTNSPELVGKTSIYRGERKAIYAGYLIKIQCLDDLNPEYLNYNLNSPEAKQYCYEVKSDGVSQSNINAQKLGEYPIQIPSLQEQNEIVRRVEQLFAYADKIEQQVNTALEKVNHLPQSILAKAFRGELTAQWRAENVDLITGENSAASLLEKIQVERAQNNKNKKKK
ncbi:restriction endonuclease subunit S [Frischella sp. Ac13]|uniref:Restriction endonuclease subunit S n=2 Tax=Frischella japonica TaxID=2741544 RepID=A0ABR7R097_9GAMM|nr:restriction endonuclease subunit S [Frischella japonica]